jgi:tRNA (mo5U34)-methyltransferase
MLNYHALYEDLFLFMQNSRLSPWLTSLEPLLKHKLQEKPHGDLARWLTALEGLPDIQADTIALDTGRIRAETDQPLTASQRVQVEQGLKGLCPWRKGPFEIFGTHIDTEWRSDWKWDRVAPHIAPLKERLVLDVGCGSGYHMWRMLGDGAARVIGIDPSYLFLMQFEAIKKYCGPGTPAHLLPLRIEDVPPMLEAFHTTFSMGVLYHRRSPIDHLLELKGTLVKGGQLVLETLVVEGDPGYALMPEDRYAMMRNVWFIPSVKTLELWLQRAGFRDIKMVDLNQTTLDEQRATDWMAFQSLGDFLDPEDASRTVEGYPSPLRATLVATK